MGCACEHQQNAMGLMDWGQINRNEGSMSQAYMQASDQMPFGLMKKAALKNKRRLALTPIASSGPYPFGPNSFQLRGLDGEKPRKQAPQAYALLPEYANDVIEEAQLDVAPMMLEGEAFGDEATVYDAAMFVPGGLTGLSADAVVADDTITKFNKIREGVASSAQAVLSATQKPITSITFTGPGGNQPQPAGTPWEKYALIAGAVIAGLVVVKALMKR